MSAPSDITYYHHAFFQHVGSDSEPSEPSRRHSASRQKLAGFSEKHLIELSADMYDELQRRLHPDRFPPGPLAPRNDIHWKRNDARKHVGSLPSQRFDDICRDLLQEQERRYPELKHSPSPDGGPPEVRSRMVSSASGTSNRSANSNQSADAYAFPLTASPRENGQTDIFESANTTVRSQTPPDLHIQSVAESKIEPQKTQIVESDDDSDSDDGVYSIYGADEHSKQKRPEDLSDADVTPRAHARDLSETSGRTSYVTIGDQPMQTSTRNPSLDSGDEFESENEFAEKPNSQSANHAIGEDQLSEGTRAAPSHKTNQSVISSNSSPEPPVAVMHPDVEQLSSRIRDLESENEQHRNHIKHLQANQRDPDLEKTLEEQRTITEKVRQEAARFLEEMRALTQQHERQVNRADTLDAEAKHWKRRYEKLQAELEATRKRQWTAAIEQPSVTDLPVTWISSSGAVSEEQLRHYLGAISALVACVHSDKGKRGDALEFLHAVVLASRALTQDKRSLIAKSATLLITVVRNFAVSKGIMPLIIVDSACSDLTMAVIDFCSKNKVRQARPASLSEPSGTPALNSVQGQAPASQAAASSTATHKKNKSSVSFQFDEKKRRELPNLPPSITSTERKPEPVKEEPRSETPSQVDVSRELASPASSQKARAVPASPATPSSGRSVETGKFRPVQGPHLPPDSSIQSLQTYLEEQTSGTVDAIGALLAGIKNNVVAGELKPRVGEIKELVGQMIDASNSAIEETRNMLLKERGTLIVDNLKDCLARMDMLLDEELEAIRDDAKPNRHLKQRLAGVSFDMAKSTKELVKTVEEAALKDELEGIDRQLH